MLMNNNILKDLIRNWLKEDVGNFDLTTQLIVNPKSQNTFNLIAREAAVVSGIEVARLIFQQVDHELEFKQLSDRISSKYKVIQKNTSNSKIKYQLIV